MAEPFDPQPERLGARVWPLPHAMASGNYARVALPDGNATAVQTGLARHRFPPPSTAPRSPPMPASRRAGACGLDGIVHGPDLLQDRATRVALPEYGIEVVFAPGHGGDHVSVFVPDDGVLIAADAIVTVIPPAFRSLPSCASTGSPRSTG